MRLFKKLFMHSPIHYGIGGGIVILYILIKLISTKFLVMYIPGSLMTAGLLVLLIGLLILCIYYGALDTFGYAATLLRKKEKRRYRDLVDYTNQKTSNRRLKELYYMPYIVIGLFILLIGFATSLFIKPLPMLDAPTNIKVVEVDGKLEVTFDKNDLAVNGYTLYYSQHVDNPNIEKLPEATYIEIEQQSTDTIKIIIDNIDLTKSYDIGVACKAVAEKYNGSYYSDEIVFKPNN